MALLQAAVNADVDTEKLKQLMDLHERWEANVRKAAYAKAMSDCEKEMPVVAKDKENKHTHSMYATLEAINQQIKPVYARHGFSLSFNEEPSNKSNEITVVATLRHRDGHSETFTGFFPIDGGGMKGGTNKTDIQAKGSTLKYACRYLTLMIFNIAIEGEDTDGNRTKKAETISPELVTNLEEMIAECATVGAAVNMPAFLGWLGVQSLADITTANYANVVTALRKKIKDAKGSSNG